MDYLFSEIYFLAKARYSCRDANAAPINTQEDCKSAIPQVRKMDQRASWLREVPFEEGTSEPEGCTVRFWGSSGNTLNHIQWNPQKQR